MARAKADKEKIETISQQLLTLTGEFYDQFLPFIILSGYLSILIVGCEES